MTLYQILGVSQHATDAEIRTAYRRLVKTAHPDAGGSNEEFIAIQESYQILSNPLTRGMYDLSLIQQNFNPRPPKFKQPRAGFQVAFSGLRYKARNDYKERYYIQGDSLVENLYEASKYYRGKDAGDILKMLAETIESMMRRA